MNRFWAFYFAILTALNTGLYVYTGHALSAGFAVLSGLMFVLYLVDMIHEKEKK